MDAVYSAGSGPGPEPLWLASAPSARLRKQDLRELIADFEISLASKRDVRRIARMSRDLIEVGLGWRWTAHRVMASLQDRDTNIAVAHDAGKLIGFAIARFRMDEAHILLLAVDEHHRRRGVGAALVRWIEKTALVAGIGIVYLEARLANTGARRFYRALGYREFRVEPTRYRGVEPGVRLGKDLWSRT